MKPVDETEKGQTETIVFEVALSHPPVKVWRTLTEPALLAEWLLPVTGLALEPGTPFTFKTAPVGGWDGVVHCKLLEVEALKRIRYAWVVGDLDMVVTFTLAPDRRGHGGPEGPGRDRPRAAPGRVREGLSAGWGAVARPRPAREARASSIERARERPSARGRALGRPCGE